GARSRPSPSRGRVHRAAHRWLERGACGRPARGPIAQHPKEKPMPEEETIERAREDAREGKAPTTQAGEFVREEIHHIREGKHGARSPEQAIAIGLSKARRAGVKLPPPRKGKAKEKTRQSAKRALKRARSAGAKRPSRT